MNDLHAFFRLAARPTIALGWVWLLWLVCGIPVVNLLESPVSVFEATSADQLSPRAWRALWQVALLFPATAGAVSAFVTLETVPVSWSWTLPSLRARLVKGLALLAALVSLPVPLLLARMDAGAAAVAALGVGAFGFGAANVFFGRGMILTLESWAALVFLVAMTWYAEHVAALATAHPWFTTLMALEGAALWAYLGYSARAVREAVALSSPAMWWRVRSRIQRERRLWRRSLVPGRVLDWVLAGHYETWGSRTRFGWPLAAATQILWFVGSVSLFTAITTTSADMMDASYLVGLAVVSGPMCMWIFPPLLPKDRVYPLSRPQRATITWTGSLAILAGFGVLLAICLPLLVGLLTLTPWVTTRSIDVTSALVRVPVILLWLPVVLWTTVRYRSAEWMLRVTTGRSRNAIGAFVREMGAGLLYMTLTYASMAVIEKQVAVAGPAAAVAAVAVLAIVVQLAYWRLLRHYFRKGDLA
ncbi:MAG TPA: hypothetical protein VLE53_04680 [Gemmatimonadaceae bacterium]|nr:hypothetical protein [Gemmatimonadaceae bacterium]